MEGFHVIFFDLKKTDCHGYVNYNNAANSPKDIKVFNDTKVFRRIVAEYDEHQSMG